MKISVDIQSGPTSYAEVEEAIYQLLLTRGWVASTIEISGHPPGIVGEE